LKYLLFDGIIMQEIVLISGKMSINIPKNVMEVITSLEKAGFEAYIVGGCARDMLLGQIPKDWDITTNAVPAEIMQIFPDSVYENQFGTVGVKTVKIHEKEVGADEEELEVENPAEKEIVEVTTYRIESTYSDRRHPDEVQFAKTLEEDLSRRDFTINAIAMKIKETGIKQPGENLELVDLFGGRIDLEKKIIRAVGDANERFNEDALRMMRAVRFSVQLGENLKSAEKKHLMQERDKDWKIEEKTLAAIKENAKNLQFISAERIKDELVKIIMSATPAKGIKLLQETGLLKQIIPELEQSIGVMQGYHHLEGPYPTVYEHLLASLEKCPSDKLEVRLAALLHDIGKPATRRMQGQQVTFYNHEYVGAKMVGRILQRLKFSRNIIDKVMLLVKGHMFYYNVDEVGESGVRRVVSKVGLENINDLIDVRIADRLGSGVHKAVPYKLRHFKYMVEKVSHDPISVKQLKINGNDLMQTLKLEAGPKIGAIMDVLLAEVLNSPALNTREKLLEKASVLMELDLEKLRAMAKEEIEEKREKEEQQIKGKYRVM
jgi:putative nucleotidyltransferase with HDIG domain